MTITLSKKATLSKKHNTKKRRIKSLTKHNKHDKPPSPRLENERRVHEEIINRRISGGITLTDKEISRAYARAYEQWQKLPGYIVRPPTDVLLIQKPKSQDTVNSLEQTHDDPPNGGSEIGT